MIFLTPHLKSVVARERYVFTSIATVNSTTATELF